jgi:hypothetical protein
MQWLSLTDNQQNNIIKMLNFKINPNAFQRAFLLFIETNGKQLLIFCIYSIVFLILMQCEILRLTHKRN